MARPSPRDVARDGALTIHSDRRLGPSWRLRGGGERRTMSLINLSFKHGQTLDAARSDLEKAVQDVRAKLGPMVRGEEWAADRNSVLLSGPGFKADMRVDPQEIHVAMDVPVLGGLLGNPIAAGLKDILQKTFHKQLT